MATHPSAQQAQAATQTEQALDAQAQAHGIGSNIRGLLVTLLSKFIGDLLGGLGGVAPAPPAKNP